MPPQNDTKQDTPLPQRQSLSVDQIFLIVGALILAALVIFFAAREGKKEPIAQNVSQNNIVNEQSPTWKPPPTLDELFSKSANESASGKPRPISGVVWLNESHKIDDLHLLYYVPTDSAHVDSPVEYINNFVDYYQLGQIGSRRVVLLTVACDGLGCGDPAEGGTGWRYIMREKDNGWEIIAANSSIGSPDVYMLLHFADTVSLNRSEVFSELTPPEEITVNKMRLTDYSSFYGTTDVGIFSAIMKNDTDLRKRSVAKHDITATSYGTLFALDMREQKDSDTFPVLESLYLTLHAGLVVGYSEQLPFLDYSTSTAASVPLAITWADGAANADFYNYRGYATCRAAGNVALLSPELVHNGSDLIPIGKTKTGESVFGFKSVQHPVVQEVYKIARERWSDIPTRDNFANKLHGLFVYKDSWGRYILFLNIRFGFDQGGCD